MASLRSRCMLLITVRTADALARAYHEVSPLETCGFLLGAARQLSLPIASEVLLSRIPPGERASFEIPDCELRRVCAYAQERGLHIMALFHSHPSGDLRLSESDRACLRYSEWPWVIITQSKGKAGVVLTGYASADASSIKVRVAFR